MQTVNWNKKTLLPTPTQKRPNRRQNHYEVVCNRCLYTRWLTKSNAEKAQQADGCLHCARSWAGRKGYRAAVKKGLRDKALEGVAAYQLANASSPERIVAELLIDAGIAHKRQVRYLNYLLDFVIGELVVEVNGAYWHQGREARDNQLKAAFGDNILFLSEEDIKTSPLTVLSEIKARLS